MRATTFISVLTCTAFVSGLSIGRDATIDKRMDDGHSTSTSGAAEPNLNLDMYIAADYATEPYMDEEIGYASVIFAMMSIGTKDPSAPVPAGYRCLNPRGDFAAVTFDTRGQCTYGQLMEALYVLLAFGGDRGNWPLRYEVIVRGVVLGTGYVAMPMLGASVGAALGDSPAVKLTSTSNTTTAINQTASAGGSSVQTRKTKKLTRRARNINTSFNSRHQRPIIPVDSLDTFVLIAKAVLYFRQNYSHWSVLEAKEYMFYIPGENAQLSVQAAAQRDPEFAMRAVDAMGALWMATMITLKADPVAALTVDVNKQDLSAGASTVKTRVGIVAVERIFPAEFKDTNAH